MFVFCPHRGGGGGGGGWRAAQDRDQIYRYRKRFLFNIASALCEGVCKRIGYIGIS